MSPLRVFLSERVEFRAPANSGGPINLQTVYILMNNNK